MRGAVFKKEKKTQSKQGEDLLFFWKTYFFVDLLAGALALVRGEDREPRGLPGQHLVAVSLPRPWERKPVVAAAKRDVSSSSSFFPSENNLFLTEDSERVGHILSPLARKTNTQCTPSYSFVLRHSLPFLSLSGEEEAATPSVLDHRGLTSQPSRVSRIPAPPPGLAGNPTPV